MKKREKITAKVFIDNGSGFDEKEPQCRIMSGEDKRFEFDLSSYGRIKVLRLDPVDDYLVLRIDRIVIVREDNSFYEPDNFNSNAMHHERGVLVFEKKFPQIFLNMFNQKLQKVIIELEYIAIGKNAIEYILKYKNVLLMDQNRQLLKQIEKMDDLERNIHERKKRQYENEKKIGELEGKIDILRFRLDILQREHALVLGPKTWKITAPLRNLYNRGRIIRQKTKEIFHLFSKDYYLIKNSGLFDGNYYLNQNQDVKNIGMNPLAHYMISGAKEGRDPNPLFATSFYLDQIPREEKQGIMPLIHYMTTGVNKGLSPNPLFDSSYYLEQNPEVAEAGENLLAHYFAKGAKEGRDPNPLFDTSFYLEQNPEVAKAGENPLVHYLAKGAKEGRDPNPLFATSFYLEQNPEVAKAGENPLAHYLAKGSKEGRDPNPLFATSFYLEQNPEVAKASENPLVHYLAKGAKEGRDPNPLFDSLYYVNDHPDVEKDGVNPLFHYVQTGFKEGKNPNALFDSSYYLDQIPNAVKNNVNPLVDYLNGGVKKGINPSPLFNTSYYLDRYPDVKKSGINPLAHYIAKGCKEGRYASPLVENITYKPLISIIIPIYNVEAIFFRKAVKSVLNQIYRNWELCIVDDGSDKAHIKSMLAGCAKTDPRIKVSFLRKNQGIAAATNKGLAVAEGRFVGLLDHDDVLTRDALYEIVKSINKKRADIIYSDERIISAEGKYTGAFFKPDFSPDLLFSHNYITHFLVVRKSLVDEVGGFSSQYDGAQDYDLLLKLTEKTIKICHVSKELYRWRSISTSTSADPNEKHYADEAGKKALEAALDRREIAGKVLKTEKRFFYRVKRDLLDHPLISIIIPFKDGADYLKSCINAILVKSRYQNFEIIGINNNSQKSETLNIMDRLSDADKRVTFYDYDVNFNFSQINNYGVGLANGDHIVLMNNDVEIINADWMESLLEHSQRDDVGAVGAKLYYSDNTIQHAGVIVGITGFAGHAHRHFPRHADGYMNRLKCIQNISAVTAALLMVKKKLYQETGGLDEKKLSVALNDVDFCLRLRKKGYLNIYTPYCEAYHYESVSRGYEETPERKMRFNREIKYFQKKWGDVLDIVDPYYNPNLTTEAENFSLK